MLGWSSPQRNRRENGGFHGEKWTKCRLTGAKRREWMGMGVAGMIITSDYGSFPKIPC